MDIVQVEDSMLENDQSESHENAPGHSDEEMEITADDNTKPATWEFLPLKHDKKYKLSISKRKLENNLQTNWLNCQIFLCAKVQENRV